jgi:hypothetical protein
VGLFVYSQGIFSLPLLLNIMKRSSPASFEKKNSFGIVYSHRIA